MDHNVPYLPPKILHNYCFQFLLGITSSSPCRKDPSKDQFAVSYFSTSLIVLIEVYN